MSLAALVCASLAFAAHDLHAPPPPLCRPVFDVVGETRTCADNASFVKAAAGCVAKLESLEAELGAEAIALAGKGDGGQRGRTATGKNEFGFSRESLAWLRQAALAALAETRLYEIHVFLPPDPPGGIVKSHEHRLQLARKQGCYADAEAAVKTAQATLEGKARRFAERERESTALETKLGARVEKIGAAASVVAPVSNTASSTKLPGATEAKKSQGSGLTGLEQDAAKRAKGEKLLGSPRK